METNREHRGGHSWLDTRCDGVTASVGLVSFLDEDDTACQPTLVCLRLRQRDLADKDSVELTPTEAHHLAALLIEAADLALSKISEIPAARREA